MPQPIPYLAFDGTCAEAMAFYAEALGGTLERVLRAADSPMAEHFKDHPEAVVHARLRLPGDGVLMAGDVGPMPYEGIKGVSITLNYDTVAAAEQAFAALAARHGRHATAGDFLGAHLGHAERPLRHAVDHQRRTAAGLSARTTT